MRGLCRGLDSAIFFHPDHERGEARDRRDTVAKSLCRDCPVQHQCRTHALTAREPFGVWGGLTAEDRTELLHPHRTVHTNTVHTNTVHTSTDFRGPR